MRKMFRSFDVIMFSPFVQLDCTDKNEYCADWAKRGECTANPEWMEENCAKSCGKCGGGGGDGSGMAGKSHVCTSITKREYHYNDVIMSAIASQITSLSIVY